MTHGALSSCAYSAKTPAMLGMSRAAGASQEHGFTRYIKRAKALAQSGIAQLINPCCWRST